MVKCGVLFEVRTEFLNIIYAYTVIMITDMYQAPTEHVMI
jgi:hypothetical protein